MRLDPELLDGPPADGARVLVLARCGDVEEAAARVADPADPEALHDLRVALRRLRSTLRALGPLLADAIPEKQVRRLRKAARLTGPARDAEVLLAWLGAARDGLPGPYRGAFDWLVERVERRRAAGLREVRGRVGRLLGRALPALTRRLVRPPPPGSGAAPFGTALAALLRAQAVALRDAIRQVAGPEDVPAIHRVRIEGKRLRYLIEPLRGVPGADATEAVQALKRLQDVVGEWHDAQVARTALGEALVEAAADRARWRERGGGEADFRPGLLALERLVVARAAALHGRLEEDHLRHRATPLLDLVYGVVAALEGLHAEPDEGAPAPAPERRLLLTALPPEAGGEVEEIEQGWLPGDRSRESYGVVRSSAGEQHFRARATGRGAAPPEPLSRADFEAFWPLTEGRRIAKRSHLPPGWPGWRFDEYLDRRLVLAVAEAGPEGPLPPWLEPLLVREVTDERGYLDEALARRPPRRAGGAVAGPGAA
jgi:CHAD domain-containing protein